jgi:hypothetical protein
MMSDYFSKKAPTQGGGFTRSPKLEVISKLGFSFEIKKCPHLKNLGHRSRLLLSRPAERIFQPDGRDQGS